MSIFKTGDAGQLAKRETRKAEWAERDAQRKARARASRARQRVNASKLPKNHPDTQAERFALSGLLALHGQAGRPPKPLSKDDWKAMREAFITLPDERTAEQAEQVAYLASIGERKFTNIATAPPAPAGGGKSRAGVGVGVGIPLGGGE